MAERWLRREVSPRQSMEQTKPAERQDGKWPLICKEAPWSEDSWTVMSTPKNCSKVRRVWPPLPRTWRRPPPHTAEGERISLSVVKPRSRSVSSEWRLCMLCWIASRIQAQEHRGEGEAWWWDSQRAVGSAGHRGRPGGRLEEAATSESSGMSKGSRAALPAAMVRDPRTTPPEGTKSHAPTPLD